MPFLGCQSTLRRCQILFCHTNPARRWAKASAKASGSVGGLKEVDLCMRPCGSFSKWKSILVSMLREKDADSGGALLLRITLLCCFFLFPVGKPQEHHYAVCFFPLV